MLLLLSSPVWIGLGGCGERDRDLRWEVEICPPSLSARTQTVEAEIKTGVCPGEVTVYAATFPVADVGPTPPLLEPGTYAFSAIAFDGSGAALGTACVDAVLPLEDGAGVEIRIGAGPCTTTVIDSGAPTDAPIDAPTDVVSDTPIDTTPPCTPGVCLICAGGVAMAPVTDDDCTTELDCSGMNDFRTRRRSDGRWEWISRTYGPATRTSCAGVGVCEPPTSADCPAPSESVVATCEVCEVPGGSPRSCVDAGDYSTCTTSYGSGRCVGDGPSGTLRCGYRHGDVGGGGSCNNICNPMGCSCIGAYTGSAIEYCGRNIDGLECYCARPPGSC